MQFLDLDAIGKKLCIQRTMELAYWVFFFFMISKKDEYIREESCQSG